MHVLANTFHDVIFHSVPFAPMRAGAKTGHTARVIIKCRNREGLKMADDCLSANRLAVETRLLRVQ